MIWQTGQKGCDAGETAPAPYMETMLKSPLLLGPSGMMLGAAMKAKASYDKSMNQWVASMGFATKRDQERSLHALNQLESRLLDLEERLETALDKKR